MRRKRFSSVANGSSCQERHLLGKFPSVTGVGETTDCGGDNIVDPAVGSPSASGSSCRVSSVVLVEI